MFLCLLEESASDALVRKAVAEGKLRGKFLTPHRECAAHLTRIHVDIFRV